MKEPLYKKWWAWIALLVVSAVIIQNNDTDEAVYSFEAIEDGCESDSSSFYEEEEVALCCEYQKIDIAPGEFLLVGTDILPGEYFVQAHENTHGFIMLARDSSGSVDSVILNKNFLTHSFITVKEGEFITVERATLIPIEKANVPTFDNGVLRDGVYRVGIDIPEGTYTLIPTSNLDGYFQIATNSRGPLSHIVSHLNFSENTVISVENGQYLTINRAQIQQTNE